MSHVSIAHLLLILHVEDDGLEGEGELDIPFVGAPQRPHVLHRLVARNFLHLQAHVAQLHVRFLRRAIIDDYGL